MICPNCGNQNADGTTFCTNCGSNLNAAPNYYQQPAQNNYQQPTQAPMSVENPAAGKALALGIIALCLCWLPIASIILGIFALKAGKEAIAYSNQGYNKRPMGIIAKVFGIVSIVLCSIYTVYWIVILVAGGAVLAYA